MPQVRAIETHYAGCHFRSRLEARWAVFFDAAGIPWTYEPQGFELSCGPYLPDFLLPECGTWIEVKGDPNRLDENQMLTAAHELPRLDPQAGCEMGPKLMLLGDIPRPRADGDHLWVGLDTLDGFDPAGVFRYGFGSYFQNRRPFAIEAEDRGANYWLSPTFDPYELSISEAYIGARTARFEHGETPHLRTTEEIVRSITRDELIKIFDEAQQRPMPGEVQTGELDR